MGFFSTKKKELTPQLLETPEQQSAKNLLSSYWQKFGANYNPTDVMSPYQPYAGELSAEMPAEYGQISPIISDYLAQPDNELLNLSADEIKKTLTGEYDPYTSEYYKSMKRGIVSDVGEAQQSLRQKAQGAGMFESLGRLLSEADVEGQGQDRLNTVLSELQWKERQNRLGVLPQAMAMGEYGENAPIRKLSAISTYGGIPASYQQSMLDRLYQEFQRQKAGQQAPLSLASNFLQSYQPNYMYPQYSESPSTFSQLLQGGSQLADIYSALDPRAALAKKAFNWVF